MFRESMNSRLEKRQPLSQSGWETMRFVQEQNIANDKRLYITSPS